MTRTTFAAFLASAAFATTALAQTISFDFDKAVNFAGFRTYAWAQGTNVPDPLIHQRMTSAIDAQMTRKGLTQVRGDARADVLVAYHAAFDTNLQITGFGSGWGGYRFAGSRTVSARAEEIVVGTMIVDIVDTSTNTIVWRGTATKDVDMNAKPEKRDKNIAKTAEKLFKHYPPQTR